MQKKSYLGLSKLGFHRIVYTLWDETLESPDFKKVPVICVHGLTRNGRDFDYLAKRLQQQHRLFCPDIVGRGESDWLSDPTLYTYPQYLSDMTALIAATGAEQVDWVGTSMGGLIGMMLAAQPQSPIRRLVINDVGPFISKVGLQRIGDYVGVMPEFPDIAAAERYLQKNYAPFGITRAEDWRYFADHSTRRLPNGKLTLAHDPGIAVNVQNLTGDIDLWPIYDQIHCPVLVVHGENSDILSHETAAEMISRGPKAKLVTFSGVGHAPALVCLEQIDLIADFLR